MKTCMAKLTRSALVALVALLAFCSLIACSKSEKEPGSSVINWDDPDQRAEDFVLALVAGDYTIAAEKFSDEMNRALGVNGLKKAWSDVIKEAGDFVRVVEVFQIPYENYDIYNVVTEHKNLSIVTRVVFSPDGKISGLFFSALDK